MAGPSSGRIRQPRDSLQDISELYARLQAVEVRTETVVAATTVTMQEMRGDLARLDSNQETQKKYILKQLVDVEELAKTAIEKTTGGAAPGGQCAPTDS